MSLKETIDIDFLNEKFENIQNIFEKNSTNEDSNLNQNVSTNERNSDSTQKNFIFDFVMTDIEVNTNLIFK